MVLYVSIMDGKGRMEQVTRSTHKSWDEQWQICNDSFGLYLTTDDELGVFKGNGYGKGIIG